MGPLDQPRPEFTCPNCGHPVSEQDPYCRNCGYKRQRNYLANLVLLAVAIVPASMATCSVAAIATALNFKKDDPAQLGAGIVAGFSMEVGPIATAFLLWAVHARFAAYYKSRIDMRSLLPTVAILGAGCLAAAVVWAWAAAKIWPHGSGVVFALVGAALSLLILGDMIRFLVWDKERRVAGNGE